MNAVDGYITGVKSEVKGKEVIDEVTIKLIGGMRERGEVVDFIRGLLRDNDFEGGFPHIKVDFLIENKNSYLDMK